MSEHWMSRSRWSILIVGDLLTRDISRIYREPTNVSSETGNLVREQSKRTQGSDLVHSTWDQSEYSSPPLRQLESQKLKPFENVVEFKAR